MRPISSGPPVRPDPLRELIEQFGPITRQEVPLQSLLAGVIKAVCERWPGVNHAAIFLQSDGSKLWQAAGEVSEDRSAPHPVTVQALARREAVTGLGRPDTIIWAAPLIRQDGGFGVIQLELPADADWLPDIQQAVSTLAVPLSLAVDYLQSAPLVRTLTLSQQLARASTLQDMVGIVAQYVGQKCTLVDLTLYEYEENEPVRAQSVVLSMAERSEMTDFSTDMADYPLSAAITDLQRGQTVVIDDVFTTPLIATSKHDYFRVQNIHHLTVIPLIAEERLIGALSVAGLLSSPDELRGLTMLANHIAVLVQNRALLERTSKALDEVQQLYRFGSAVLNAQDPASLVQAVYEQFSAQPDELVIETVHLSSEGNPLAFVVEAAVVAGKLSEPGTLIDVMTYHLEAYVQALQSGAPLLINNLKTDPTVHPATRTYFTGRNLQAVGVFPIVIDGKLRYTIRAAYFAPHIFTAPEIRQLHRLSEQVGLEMRSWELLKQTQEQAERLARQVRLMESLYETSRQVSVSLASPDVLQTTCHNLTQTLGLSYVAIVRFDQVPGSGNIVAEYPPQSGASVLFLLQDFGAYKHLQTYQTPVVVNEVRVGNPLLGPNVERFQSLGIQSLVMVPLLVQGELIGMLVLATGDPNRTFSQEEIHVNQAIATQIAISLHNVQLFTQIQRHANQLERSAAFGRLVTSTFDRDEIMRHVADVIPTLLPADRVMIALNMAGRPTLELITLTDRGNLAVTSLPAEGSSVQEIVRSQSPLLIADLTSSTYTDHQRMAQESLRSVASAPLAVGGRTLGIITVGHRRPRMYTPTDLTLLQQIGNQIAIALENARLYQAAHQRALYEQSLSEITSRLQQQSNLQDLLQETMQDLGKVLGANRARVRLQAHPNPNGGPGIQKKE